MAEPEDFSRYNSPSVVRTTGNIPSSSITTVLTSNCDRSISSDTWGELSRCESICIVKDDERSEIRIALLPPGLNPTVAGFENAPGIGVTGPGVTPWKRTMPAAPFCVTTAHGWDGARNA